MINTTQLLKTAAIAFCSGLLTTLVYHYFNSKRNEAIFFCGNDQELCDFHSGLKKTLINKIHHIRCHMCKVDIIIGWINETKKTLDICMYMFNCELFSNAIISAHKRGVLVRLIVNEDFVRTTWKMGEIGISKKVKKSPSLDNLMHHKFVIIDNNKIILGSLNWTIMAIRKNWENIFITNDRRLVDPFRQEFEQIWTTFK